MYKDKKQIYASFFLIFILSTFSLFSSEGETSTLQKELEYNVRTNPCSSENITSYIDLSYCKDAVGGAEVFLNTLDFKECLYLKDYTDAYLAFNKEEIKKSEEILSKIKDQGKDDPFIKNLFLRIMFKKREYEKVIKEWEAFKDSDIPCELRVRILKDIGLIYFITADYEKAKQFWERGDNITNQCLASFPLKGFILQNKATIFLLEEKYDDAIRIYFSLLKTDDFLLDSATKGICYSNLSIAYRSIGDYFKALESQQNAIKYLEKSNRKDYLASSLYNTGNIYIELGMYEKAKEYFIKTVGITKEIDDSRLLTKVYGALGYVASLQEDETAALGYFEDSIKMAEALNDSATLLSNLQNLGNLLLSQGKIEEAKGYYQRGLTLSREKKDTYSEKHALINLGNALFKEGELDNALKLLDDAEEMVSKSESKGLLWNVYWYKAQVYWGQKKVEQSMAFYEKAIGILDEIRKSLEIEELQKAYSASVLTVYENYLTKLRMLYDVRKEPSLLEKAFIIMEKKKAQILLEFLTKSGIKEVQKENLSGLKTLQRYLKGKKALLLSYSLGEAESHLLIISPDSTELFALPPEKKIIKDVRYLLGMTTTGNDSPSLYGRVSYLVEPVLKKRGFHTLIISVDGLLHYLPFEALQVRDGKYLIENYSVFYAPSVSVLMELSEKPENAPDTLFAVGNPDISGSSPIQFFAPARESPLPPLPFAEKEVRDIGRYYPQGNKILTGREATESAVKAKEIKNFGILHFAAHGLVNEGAPQYSGIVLCPGSGEDGFLTAKEILGLKIKPNHVTLSACETGKGEIARGEGVIGLARAFLYAGAKDMLVSLWRVDDFATSKLMGQFYRFLSKGKPANEALRLAKIELIRNKLKLDNEELNELAGKQGAGRDVADSGSGKKAQAPDVSSPFYWAGFVLIGAGN